MLQLAGFVVSVCFVDLFVILDLFRWSRDPAVRLIAHGKEGPHVFPVPSLLQQVPFCAAFDFGLVGICLVSGSDEQETKFFSFSWQNHAVLLLVVVHLGSWSQREDVLGQLVIDHGFLSGLFTPLGCAAYGSNGCAANGNYGCAANGNYGSR